MMMRQPDSVRNGDGRIWTVSFLLLLTVLFFLGAAATVQAQDPVLPAAPPDAAAGLALYADRCANCHGAAGNGDGELSGNLPLPPRIFTDPAFRQTAVPSAYYTLIVNGNLEAGMPPFGAASSNPLTAAQVWNAIAAVFALATPAEAVAQGQAVYQANCLSCHGENGIAAAPEVTNLETAVPNLTDLDYWFNRSNDVVFASLEPGKLTGHDYQLGEADLRAVVDYARTFSYVYVSQAAADEPIAAATISGFVTNATTGGVIGDLPVLLRGFTADIQQSLALTTTADAVGAYSFDLSDVDPDWVYLISVNYGDLNFSSDVGQLSQSETDLVLPITVYEQTTNPAAINVAQVHVVVEFLSETVMQVTELYVYENQETAVFVGERGNADLGTIRINVPANAQSVSFERAFSGMDSFIPATEIVQTTTGYADTIPLRPGRSAVSLIVNYTLPYDNGATISYQMPYAVTNATIILPEVGVELTSAGWTEQSQQTMGGLFRSYTRQNLAAGSTFEVQLAGEPQQVSGTAVGGGGVTAPRNQTTEIIIGGLALAGVLGGAFYVLRARQAAADVNEDEDEDEAVGENGRTADELIQLIADLDDAFANGDLDEADYQAQRADLKAELKAIW